MGRLRALSGDGVAGEVGYVKRRVFLGHRQCGLRYRDLRRGGRRIVVDDRDGRAADACPVAIGILSGVSGSAPISLYGAKPNPYAKYLGLVLAAQHGDHDAALWALSRMVDTSEVRATICRLLA